MASPDETKLMTEERLHDTVMGYRSGSNSDSEFEWKDEEDGEQTMPLGSDVVEFERKDDNKVASGRTHMQPPYKAAKLYSYSKSNEYTKDHSGRLSNSFVAVDSSADEEDDSLLYYSPFKTPASKGAPKVALKGVAKAAKGATEDTSKSVMKAASKDVTKAASKGTTKIERKWSPQVTKGAVEALIKGAASNSLEINAIDQDGVSYVAGQVITDDDKVKRAGLDSKEFYPILAVKRAEWLGTMGDLPIVKIVLTDGENDIFMRPSMCKGFRSFWKLHNGPFRRGCINPGKLVKLLDYTTSIRDWGNDKNVPCVHVEKLRAPPKRRSCKFEIVIAECAQKVFNM
jgi:hypothetical protein